MAQETPGQGCLSRIDAGSGEAVLLLHSSASCNLQWRGLIELLRSRHRVIAPDIAGYGGSPARHSGKSASMAGHAALVARSLAGVQGPVHVVGHSFGGAIALRFARDYPHLVRTLTVYEPVAFWTLDTARDWDRRWHGEIAGVANVLRRALRRGAPGEGVARFIEFWSGPGAWEALRPELRDQLAPLCGSIIADFEAIAAEPPGLEQYRAMAFPALVMHGCDSPRVTVRIARWIAAVMPHACLRAVPGAGHMGPVTHARAVNPIITAHIGLHCSGARAAPMNPVIDRRRPSSRERISRTRRRTKRLCQSGRPDL